LSWSDIHKSFHPKYRYLELYWKTKYISEWTLEQL
jgi:hypothetical protein